MSAKLKWELRILGEDLGSETATLIEMIKLLKAHDLPAPTDFITTHSDPLATMAPALPVEKVIPPPPPDPPKRTRKGRAPPDEPDDKAAPVGDSEVAAVEQAQGDTWFNGYAELDALTGAEARDKALTLLRLSYAAPDGGAEAVKGLQKALKIAKFTDVPDDKGHALLASAIKIATQFGLVTP